MDMESFGNNTPSSAEEILQSLEKTPETLIIDGTKAEIRRIDHYPIYKMLAQACGLYFTDSEKDISHAEPLSEIYEAGIALGYRLYGKNIEGDVLWEQLSGLADIIDLATISDEDKASVPLGRLVELYAHDAQVRALAVANELPSLDRAVIAAFIRQFAADEQDAQHFRAAVGLVADVVNLVSHDLSSPSYQQDLSGQALRTATLDLFRELRDNPTWYTPDYTPADTLDDAVQQLNQETIMALFYNPSKTISAHEHTVYLVRDIRNGSTTFNRLSTGQILEGVFREFAHAPIPEYGEYDTISRKINMSEFRTLDQGGLYIQLDDTLFGNADGTEVRLNANQELLIPIEYAGQTIFSER